MSHSVRSWDIFDTILARRCYEPTGVFDLIGERLQMPHFTKSRKDAEHTSRDRSFAGIYRSWQQLDSNMTQAGCDRLMALELATEGEQAYLIPEIYNQIEDGDVLISDMYLDGQTLLNLLRSIGFAKDVKVYASYSGKSQGHVWQQVKNDGYNITLHTGDNYHSDVISPHWHGVSSRHYAHSGLSALEQMVMASGFGRLARLMRTTRLKNPFLTGSIDHLMWNEQAQLNGPILYLACMRLNALLKARPDLKKILFVTRDGCHWHKLYQALFPSDEAHYFHASRSMYYRPTDAYMNYVNNFGDPSHIVLADVFGTGTSTYGFFSQYTSGMPLFYTITAPNFMPFSAELKMLNRAVVEYDRSALSVMEFLNYDMVGTLVDFTEQGPVRLNAAPDVRFIQTYHSAIHCFIAEAQRIAAEQGPVERANAVMERLLDVVHQGVSVSHLVRHDPQFFVMRAPYEVKGKKDETPELQNVG